MKFGEKDFSEYWKIIKIPTYVLIGWSVFSFIVSILSFSLYQTIFTPIASWILTIAVFGFIGWTAVKDHKQGVRIAAWAAALSGAIAGFIGAILGILMFYFVPDVIQAAITQATQAGVDAAAVQGFMSIGVYFGLITGPLISAIIGAAIAAVVAFISKKM